MKCVRVLVEGQTEETFVQDVLAPELWPGGVALIPTIASTKRVHSGGKFKGGITSYQRVASQVRDLLRDTSASMVTTMLDLYGLPDDFPGSTACPSGNGAARAAHLERHFAEDIRDARFRPYFSVHEFEALLFADLDACATIFPGSRVPSQLREQRAGFRTPEDVNDGPDTAPSKRVLGACPGYEKPFHGPFAALLIGLRRLRAECPRFDAWVRDLEQAGTTPPHSSTG